MHVHVCVHVCVYLLVHCNVQILYMYMYIHMYRSMVLTGHTFCICMYMCKGMHTVVDAHLHVHAVHEYMYCIFFVY